MLFSLGIHVKSIYLSIRIVISVILRDKSILWAYKNNDYFLHSCSIFLNFRLFIQSIILRHTSVEHFNHVKTFLTHFMLILMIIHIFLSIDFVHSKKKNKKNVLKICLIRQKMFSEIICANDDVILKPRDLLFLNFCMLLLVLYLAEDFLQKLCLEYW